MRQCIGQPLAHAELRIALAMPLPVNHPFPGLCRTNIPELNDWRAAALLEQNLYQRRRTEKQFRKSVDEYSEVRSSWMPTPRRNLEGS